MGFDAKRFTSEIDESLLCTICSNLLEDPVMVYIFN